MVLWSYVNAVKDAAIMVRSLEEYVWNAWKRRGNTR